MDEELDLLNVEGDQGGTTATATASEDGGEQTTQSVGDIEQQALANPHEWAKTLDESLRNEPTLHKFKDVSTLAKSYMELEKTRGKSPFPGPKATPEELEAFYRKAGIPDAKDYTLDQKAFGLSDEMAAQLKEVASKNGIPPHGLAATLKLFQETHNKAMEDTSAQTKAQIMEQIEEIKKEYGTAFDKYKKLAVGVVKEVFTESQLETLKTSGLLNEPMFVKLLMDRAKTMYGEEMIEDDHTVKGIVATPQAVETRITEIMSDPDYFDSTKPRHNILVKELEKLYLTKNTIK